MLLETQGSSTKVPQANALPEVGALQIHGPSMHGARPLAAKNGPKQAPWRQTNPRLTEGFSDASWASTLPPAPTPSPSTSRSWKWRTTSARHSASLARVRGRKEAGTSAVGPCREAIAQQRAGCSKHAGTSVGRERKLLPDPAAASQLSSRPQGAHTGWHPLLPSHHCCPACVVPGSLAHPRGRSRSFC